MRDALAFLAAHTTAVLVVLGVATFLVLAYLTWVLLRARRKKDEDKKKDVVADAGAPAPVAMVTQAAELEISFRRAMKAIRSVTSGSGHRYKIPWYLMLGQSGTGKSTLLESLPVPRRVQPGHGDLATARPAGWHFFDGGVVVDVAGSLTLKRNLSSDEVGWRRLLGLLKRYRPERPIDGVVLTLSAADLLAWEHTPADELRAIGAGLFRVLSQAQKELGVRFPVYVLLTNADRLPGFSSFVSAIPKRFHQDIFGWSTPYALDSAFRGEWVDEAFDDISDWLRNRATEALASRSMLANADAVYRFPDVLDRLLPAARTVLGEIFEESAYHEAFFLRGIYLTGHKDEDAAAPAEHGEEAQPHALEEGDHQGDTLFGARLFTKKIFPERGLARGFRRGILDRNRSVRWLQIAAAAILLIGIPGMWIGHNRLQRKAQPLEDLLDSVGHNLSTMSAARSRATAADTAAMTQMGAENVVFSLLQQMASLNAGPFWSVFLPSSWFSDIDEEITTNLTAGFQDVILPTLRQGIVEWTDTMSDEGWAETIGGRVPLDDGSEMVRSSRRFQEYEVLVRYLSEVRQFTESAGLFNDIAQQGSSDVQTFSDLYVWYYEEELPKEFFENDAFYKRALSSATETPLSAAEWPGFETASAQVATQLADRFYNRLVDAVGGLEQSFAGTSDPNFSAADLRMLWQDVGQVQDLLTSSDSSWFDADAPLAPSLRAEIDSIPESPLFSKPVFVAAFTRGFTEVRRRHLQDLSRELALLSQALPVADTADHRVGGGVRLDIAPQLATLRSALGDLLNRGFMAPTPETGGQPRPTLAGRPTWNTTPLDEALNYYNELESFKETALLDVPPQLRGLVLNVAGRSLEDRVRWCIDRAMTYDVGVGPEGRAGAEADLKKRLASFDQAARRLVGMLEVDDKLGGTPAGSAVAETIILEGSDLLNEVDELLDRDGLYEPVNGNLAVWQGKRTASFVGFGVNDADGLEAYLASQRDELRTLGNYAAPTLGYFALQPVADLLRTDGPDLVPNTDALVRKWRGIVRTLDDYEKKTPGNSLETLEQFIRQGMAVQSLSGCSTVASPVSGAPRDYFETVAVRLSRMLTDRCRQLARQALLQGYGEMTRFFAARLAGRFPFVDLSTTPDAPDADVASVKEFLEMYDRVATPLAGDPASVVESLLGGELPADFFRKVGEVHDFLMPVLSPGDKGVAPPLHYRAYLRTNRKAERGADQIVDWRLSVGGQSVSYRDGGSVTGVWRPGDSTSVSLTWASESDRRPVADPGRPDITVSGSTITWHYAGPWSLLRMLADHRPAAADMTGSPAEDRGTANLRVLTRSRDAISEPQDAREAVASVFLRLGFSETADGAEVDFPRFPVRVPPTASR